jgi:hypothetical protein
MQVEPRLGATPGPMCGGVGPGIYRALRVGCHSAGSNSRYGIGKALYGSVAAEGGDQEEPSLEAGVELAERGARRAVIDFWGRLHGFTQLGMPKRSRMRGTDSVGRYHPFFTVTEMGLRCAGPLFEEEPPAWWGRRWETRTPQPPTRTSRAG